jgi:cell wall-associated NlpC family hydrolase
MDSDVRSWLSAALADESLDVLGIGLEYASGGPRDAAYAFAADFNDYLGIAWTYGTVVDQPEQAELGALDCSGFVRMVFGYRLGMPMSLGPAGASSLPRKALDQFAAGPGVLLAGPESASRSLDALRPGDLVFFDASAADGTAIDHVGIYLGLDTHGHHRFLSSRRSADGPTMGDTQGASILDGTGLWARSLRGIRRI